MNTIYKYIVPEEIEFTLELPVNAIPLSTGLQGEVECIWVLLDTEAPKISKKFFQVGTGWNLDNYINVKGKFIGTIIRKDLLVKHIFMEVSE